MIQAWLAKLTLRTVGIIALGLLFAALLMWGPQACNNYFAAKTQGRLDKGNVEAANKTIEEAMKTVDQNTADAVTIDQTVKESQDEIDKAPSGYRNDASIRASCRMKSFKHNPRCKEFQ